MTMWIIIMWTIIALLGASLVYIGIRIPNLFSIDALAEWGKFKQFSLGLLMTLAVAGVITLCIDFVNAIVCVLYLAMIWAASDFVFWIIQKMSNVTFEHYYAGWTALGLTVLSLTIGWYLGHGVWQTDYNITTSKEMPDLKVAMFADSHLGTTFDAKGFAKHLKTIESQNPDIVVVVGDYVDDSTTKEQMIEASRALGQMKTKYGVYFVSGNHDKAYYGAARRGFSEQDLMEELTKDGVVVLRDEAVLVNDTFYVIGRKDFSEVNEKGGKRQSMEELTANLDKSKYMITLDHQPVEYDKDADAEIDLVLSGHTHCGQLFPFNQVGKWIKANDSVYGYERRNKTDFIVTSGISSWAIKFKTGTKSEYVIVNIKKKAK